MYLALFLFSLVGCSVYFFFVISPRAMEVQLFSDVCEVVSQPPPGRSKLVVEFDRHFDEEMRQRYEEMRLDNRQRELRLSRRQRELDIKHRDMSILPSALTDLDYPRRN